MATPGIDLRPGEWEIIREILRRHVPDREVWAFGSRANQTAKKFSDLDLAILGDQPLTLSTLAELADDFSESDLPFKVDILDEHGLSRKARG
jgi:type I restriction enzyme S subunit